MGRGSLKEKALLQIYDKKVLTKGSWHLFPLVVPRRQNRDHTNFAHAYSLYEIPKSPISPELPHKEPLYRL